MSSFIFKNNRIYSFREYCQLNESVKPKKIDYGLNDNTDDKKFYKFPHDSLVTFFKDETINLTIAVICHDNGEIGFGQSNVKGDYIKNFHTFSDNQTGAGQALKVFSNVMYVIVEMVKQHDIPIIRFYAANQRLGKLYDNLIKNKFFINEIEKLGFSYKGINDSYYVFEK